MVELAARRPEFLEHIYLVPDQIPGPGRLCDSKVAWSRPPRIRSRKLDSRTRRLCNLRSSEYLQLEGEIQPSPNHRGSSI